MYKNLCNTVFSDLVKGWWQLRVNKLKEEASERLDLSSTSHADTAGSQWGY